MKRFTATEKWDDKWFRTLPPPFKLGIYYLYDNCDAAGVYELDEEAANFKIGLEVDWSGLVTASKGRIEILPNGRLYLTRFITFQYGELSEDCKPHRPILKLLEKHGLSERFRKGFQTLQEKEQEKDKEKDTDLNKEKKKVAAAKVEPAEVETPEFETTDLTDAVVEWLAYKAERKERYKPAGLKALFSHIRNLASEHGPEAIVEAIRRAMANSWKGFEHDIGAPARASPATSRQNPKLAAITPW